MNKLIFSIFFSAAVFVFSTVEVFACICMHNKGTVESTYQGDFQIFSGKVIGSVKSGKWDRRVTIRIQNSWKRKLPKTVTVSTAVNGSMCGFSFKKGENYLIYAYGGRANDLSVSLCSRTTFLSDAAEDIEILDNLREEAKPAPE